MTSPVDFISGERSVSTPGNLLKGSTASLTLTKGIFFIPVRPKSASFLPSMTLTAIFARGTPVVLDTKGTVREARGIDLDDVEPVVLDRELDIQEAQDARAPCARASVVSMMVCIISSEMRQGRDDAGGVARMDARLLHVLHDGADVDVLAVADGVDVDLDGVLEEIVHQDRVLGRELHRGGDVVHAGCPRRR